MPRRAPLFFALLVIGLLLAPVSALAGTPREAQRDAGQVGDAPDMAAEARALPGVGRYVGELAGASDREDWYALHLPGGMDDLRVVMNAYDNAVAEVYDPDGARVPGTFQGASVASAVPGTWRIRVVSPPGTSQIPYLVTLGGVAKVAPIVTMTSAAPVVVAQFDTGTNPFHPCFRRPGLVHPADAVPGYPRVSLPVDLTFGATYEDSLQASQAALDTIQDWTLHHVPDTALSYHGGTGARATFVDTYPHGAQASSQIACGAYGLAPNAHLVILPWYAHPGDRVPLLEWVTAQDWIDVVHLNVQDGPSPTSKIPQVNALIASGKLVVIAAGNGVNGGGTAYPSELSRYNGPVGSLVAGAIDGHGYTSYSNYNPDVSMDGSGTLAAAPRSFGTTTFGGTSSASPRLAGYAARLLGELRHEFGHTGQGLLTLPAGATPPAEGPLSDGTLTAAELHEVIRKTADPRPHPSAYDGSTGSTTGSPPEPSPLPLPFSNYAKMGYGEVSEHTLQDAIDVAAGRAPMPTRLVEDVLWSASQARRLYWG